MALYRYTALNASGRSVTGRAEAGTPAEVRANLRSDGLYATAVELFMGPAAAAGEKGNAKAEQRRSAWRGFGGRRLDLLVGFSRHLAMLLKAGLPIAQSLAVLSEQVEDAQFRIVIEDLAVRVKEGAALDEALAVHPGYFPEIFVCVTRAGAASGHLPEILGETAQSYARQKRMRDKVVSALTYPALMCVIGIAVLVFLLAYVVPKVTSVLLEQRQVLPWPTEVLLGTSTFVQEFWWALIVGIGFLGWLVSVVLRTDRGKRAVDRLLLALPVLGELFRKQAVARWADTMGSLVASGIPVAEALNIVRNTLGNRLLADEIARLETKVIEGADLSESLKDCRYMPKSIGFVVGVGEESGELARVLREVARGYNEEVEVVSGRLTDLVNPVLIVFLGVAVGFIVAAILLPITDFANIQ